MNTEAENVALPRKVRKNGSEIAQSPSEDLVRRGISVSLKGDRYGQYAENTKIYDRPEIL